ncbi:MAG: ABC transporter permease subunit [Chlorobi bacterium]|nr:ABC transporter permease subunit [Chlorobiota bacterium]
MWQVFKKDFLAFIASKTGLVVGVVFWLITALFLWLMEGNYNILYSGLAELTPFFELVPWLFIFLIPAVSMRSLAEEYRSGTIEILLTKPVREWQVVAGKFLAVWFSVLILLIPAVVYYFSIKKLAVPGQGPDFGMVSAGMTGLKLLAAVFAAAGVWVSSLTSNQMAAYLGGVFLNFLLFYGAYGLGSFNLLGKWDYLVQNLSLYARYRHFVKGLIYWNDILYFLGWTFLFLGLAVYAVQKRKG